MGTNSILRFSQTDTGTNLLSQAAYLADSQRTNGNQPGTARLQLVNKALRQTSLVAAAIGNWIAGKQAADVVDTLTDAQLATLFDDAFNAAFTLRLSAAQVVLPGSIMFWPASTPPSGWTKRNGVALNRITYAALFAVIGTTYGAGDGSTTFNVPDDRAIFERGWDDARGIDIGRVFGSTQASANLAHNHTGTANSAGAHQHSTSLPTSNAPGGGGTNIYLINGPSDGPTSTTLDGAHTHTLTINSSGDSESRPFNRAYLPIIKF